MNLLNLLDNNVIFGENSLVKLKGIIEKGNYKNLLLITGEKSFELSSAKDFFREIENIINIKHFSYSGKALPIEDIDCIYTKIKNTKNIDLIIGIGGGSVLDITKVLSLLSSNQIKDINEILIRKDLQNSTDLILIPTTAGSGSEATSFAVVYKNKRKFSIDSSNLGLKHVILDSQLLVKLPPKILKVTILDALSQSIESIWAKGATELSQSYAKAALKILYKNLFVKKSLDNLDDYLLASHLAGKAINISKTTAAHAISYPLTSEFGIPHGLAVFLTLPNLCKFNYNNMKTITNSFSGIEHKNSYIEILFEIFEINNISQFLDKLISLFDQFNFDSKLKNYGINNNNIKNIAQKAFNNGRLDNNPVKLTIDNIEEILVASFY